MRAIRRSFFHMLTCIWQDKMLFAALLAPLLAGIAMKCAVPFVETVLIRTTGERAVLSAYYGLVDIFFASIAPAMFCFAAAMVMLEERDDHIDRYLLVTGLGRKGYFLSRIVLPAFAAFLVTAALLPVFGLSDLSVEENVLLSLTGALQGILIALLIVTVSSNKLEGMAVTKLASLILFGAVVPYFVPAPVCFCFFFLPSFWMGMAISERKWFFMLPSVFTAGSWILLFWRNYSRKF